jgi:hypothetical protein
MKFEEIVKLLRDNAYIPRDSLSYDTLTPIQKKRFWANILGQNIPWN